MPWEIKKKNGKFCVVKKTDGSVVHCHPTEEMAKKQMAALYASEAKSNAGGGDARWNPSEILFREATLDERAINADKRTCEMSISSELPVNRGSYDEVLSHDPSDCDMSRMGAGGHPLLLNHDADRQVGVVESARIDADKKLRAIVRFSKSPLGEEIWNDVRDGIRRLVSVGYRRTKEVGSEKVGDREVVRFAWQPYEASIVPIPADATVGVGRSQSTPQQIKVDEPPIPIMTETLDEPKVDVRVIKNQGVEAERNRVKEIDAIEKLLENKIPGCKEMCGKARAEGTDIQDLRDQLFRAMPGVTPVSKPVLDIPQQDLRRYSLARAINSMADMKLGTGKFDGVEREVHEEMCKIAKRSGIEPEGLLVPNGILAARADNIASTGTLGGLIVPVDYLAGEFIEVLRNKCWVAKLGARMMSGLQGTVLIPRQGTGATPSSGAGTAYWPAAEQTATTQSTPFFNQITLTPKAVTGFMVYSKQLLAQSSPSVDQLLRDDMLQILTIAIDLAALHSQTNGPTGIDTSAATTVAIGTDGGNPTFKSLISMESAVAVGNADVGSLAYLTNPKVRGYLKSAVKSTFSGAYGFIWEPNDTVNGYRSVVTNQAASNLTKGTNTTVASAIFYGNWNDFIIGSWGGTDIVVDPYTNATTRGVRLFAHNFIDMAVRHPLSFAVCLDALTS